MADVICAFGFASEGVDASLFQHEGKIVRMGNPPFRIEVLTSISGVTFDACFVNRDRHHR